MNLQGQGWLIPPASEKKLLKTGQDFSEQREVEEQRGGRKRRKEEDKLNN